MKIVAIIGADIDERGLMSPSPPTRADLPHTERRHPEAAGLDAMSAQEILELMNAEDGTVAAAVREALPELAQLVEHAATALSAGGSVHYFGAGTSGRLAVLDAAELIPTFNLEPGRVVAHIAGGSPALVTAVEGSEDSESAGAADAASLGAADIAIGIAASGTTPFVAGALRAARERGARTALITSNPRAALLDVVDHAIVADTGAEVLTGSTRLKAGTAAKLILNGFSTALMIRHGRVWSNLMVSVVASNAKLRERSVRILRDATDMSPEDAAALLAAAGGDLKAALVSRLGDTTVGQARALLDAHQGSVRDALAARPR